LGLLVIGVDAGGPAQKAGLLLGDVLITFDGQPVADPAELLAAMSSDRVGAEVEVGVIRAGRGEKVRVTVGERPSERRETRRGRK